MYRVRYGYIGFIRVSKSGFPITIDLKLLEVIWRMFNNKVRYSVHHRASDFNGIVLSILVFPESSTRFIFSFTP